MIAILFQHPAITRLRYGQCALALLIFFYAALKPADAAVGDWPAWSLHLLGNGLLIASLWLALLFILHWPALIALALGLSLTAELAQGLTPTRVVDPMDMLANLCGLALGTVLCWLAAAWLQLKKP